MKKLILLLATACLINFTSHAVPSRGQVLGGVLTAAITADILRNGKQSFLGRNAIQVKEDIALLISLATSKQTLREKLTTLRQLFGRNWGKITLFFLFVVVPLIQHYRTKKAKNAKQRPRHLTYVFDDSTFETKEAAQAAIAQVQPTRPDIDFVPVNRYVSDTSTSVKWKIGRRLNETEYQDRTSNGKSIRLTKNPDYSEFSFTYPIRSIWNLLSIPGIAAYHPNCIRSWLGKPVWQKTRK